MAFPLDLTALQVMTAALGYYKGAVDNLRGPKIERAVEIVIGNAGMTAAVAYWPWERRAAAAMQIILDRNSYEPGVVDGWIGHNTHEALTLWRSDRAGVDASVDRTPIGQPVDRQDLPRQKDCREFYGDPAKNGVAPHVQSFDLPFDMRLDWNLGQKITRVRLHEKCGAAFVTAMTALEVHYGNDNLRALGIDRFAGSYVHRKMRGGTSWSMHAYGCAVDLYAQPNGLRMSCPQALFCGAEYKPLLDIMEAHGWLPAVRLWGKDAMHFQMARL